MVLLSALSGLIAASAGFVAIVARFRIKPFYSFLVRLSPKLRRLQNARDAVADRRSVNIGEEQEILETLHEVAVEEYGNISGFNDRVVFLHPLSSSNPFNVWRIVVIPVGRFCYCPACDTVLAKDVSDEVAQTVGVEHRRETDCGVSVEGNIETLDRTLAASGTELSRGGTQQGGDDCERLRRVPAV